MGNAEHGATPVNLRVILPSTEYNKFERFSNVVHEISEKLLSSFLECEVLVVIPDRYGFEFSIKGVGHWTEDSTHIQETEIINN